MWLVRGAVARGRAAERAEFAARKFDGWVNGIYIYPSTSRAPRGDPATGRIRCTNAELRWVSGIELRRSPRFPVGPAYLPAGTREVRTEGSACGRDVVVISREFQGDGYLVAVDFPSTSSSG